jgi:hypothetical protein
VYLPFFSKNEICGTQEKIAKTQYVAKTDGRIHRKKAYLKKPTKEIKQNAENVIL